MRGIFGLITLLIGNLARWISYGGTKPMSEVLKEDNGILGFIIVLFILFFIYSFYK